MSDEEQEWLERARRVIFEAFPMQGERFSLWLQEEQGTLQVRENGLVATILAVLWKDDKIESVTQEEVVLVCEQALPPVAEPLAQYLAAVEVVIGQQRFERLAKNPPHTWFDEHVFDDFKGGSLEDYVRRLQPEAIAQHRMINWLANPMEFGTEPTSITLWDNRIIHWPPADDEREMFLFKYEYAASEKEDVRRGVGLVGGTTFSLFGEDAPSPDGTPEDALAVHCMMELHWQDDPRGKDRSVKAGRKILGL